MTSSTFAKAKKNFYGVPPSSHGRANSSVLDVSSPLQIKRDSHATAAAGLDIIMDSPPKQSQPKTNILK